MVPLEFSRDLIDQAEDMYNFVYIFSRGLIDPAQLSHFVNLIAQARVRFGKNVKDTVLCTSAVIS